MPDPATVKRGRGRPRKDGLPKRNDVYQEPKRGKLIFQFNVRMATSNDIEVRDEDGKQIVLLKVEK